MLNDKYMEFIKDEYKISYTLYMKGDTRMQAFSSHQPTLIHLLNTIDKGDVLEFGMGWNSTPIMHIICSIQNRKLLSVDTNPEWFAKFTDYKSDSHEILHIPNIELIKWDHPLFKRKWSIAFVDGAPAETRQPFIEQVKDIADYIIVHDSECIIQKKINCYKYNFVMFKHVLHFRPTLPSTSVLSNLETINPDILSVVS